MVDVVAAAVVEVVVVASVVGGADVVAPMGEVVVVDVEARVDSPIVATSSLLHAPRKSTAVPKISNFLSMPPDTPLRSPYPGPLVGGGSFW